MTVGRRCFSSRNQADRQQISARLSSRSRYPFSHARRTRTESGMRFRTYEKCFLCLFFRYVYLSGKIRRLADENGARSVRDEGKTFRPIRFMVILLPRQTRKRARQSVKDHACVCVCVCVYLQRRELSEVLECFARHPDQLTLLERPR